MDVDLLLAGSAVALGGVVRGFAGFGAALIIVPLLSWLYSPIEAVVTCALMEVVGFLPLLLSAARFSRWSEVGPAGLASLLTVPVGVWLLVTLDPLVARRLFSLVVLAFVVALAAGWRYNGRRPVPVAVGVGGVSGVLAGLANMGGPPVVLLFLSRSQKATEIRASIIVLLIAQTLTGLAIYFWHGLVTGDVATRCLVLAPIYVLALWTGARLFGFSSDIAYRRIALAILSVIGLVTLVA